MNKDTTRIIDHITDSKEEILRAINSIKSASAKPLKSTSLRGPSNTRMMRIQRTALIIYVYVELHHLPEDVTLSDAAHVWNLPEHKKSWEEASRRKDARRGYKDYTSLYAAVHAAVSKKGFDLSKITTI